MTVSGLRTRRPACARAAAAGPVLSVVSGVVLSGMALSGMALAFGTASAAAPPGVALGPVDAGQPLPPARTVARNPFLPLTGPGAGAPAGEGPAPVLRRGDTGDDVRRLQQALSPRADGPGALVVDGLFGPRTAAAVVTFQSVHGLVADGLVGQRTWEALASAGGR